MGRLYHICQQTNMCPVEIVKEWNNQEAEETAQTSMTDKWGCSSFWPVVINCDSTKQPVMYALELGSQQSSERPCLKIH